MNRYFVERLTVDGHDIEVVRHVRSESGFADCHGWCLMSSTPVAVVLRRHGSRAAIGIAGATFDEALYLASGER